MSFGEHVDIKMMIRYFSMGLNITTDNFFTRLIAAKKLHQHNITIICSVVQNWKMAAEELRLRSYLTKRASRRRPLPVFFNLLGIVCLNSYVISKDTGVQSPSRRKFLHQLSKALSDTECQRCEKNFSRFAAVLNQSGDARTSQHHDVHIGKTKLAQEVQLITSMFAVLALTLFVSHVFLNLISCYCLYMLRSLHMKDFGWLC